MRHKLIVILSVLLIIGSTYASVRAYDHYQVHARAVAATQAARKAADEKLQKAAVAAETKRLSDECHKNQAFYDAQAVAYKKATARPVCDLPIVQ